MENPPTEEYNAINSEKLLVEAATRGDIVEIVSLLNDGVSVDAEEYTRLLFYASKNYLTPLQIACANGHTSCAEYLIHKGANLDAKDRFDVTALHLAAEAGNTSSLKVLLKANAECSPSTGFSKRGCYNAVPYQRGTTPLHLAATNNHIECIQELIRCGADYNAVDELGRTSLYISAQCGYGEAILAHLNTAIHRDILSLPSFETGDTPLHFAVRRNMFDCVQALLTSGSDANHKNFAGYSPLHLSVIPNAENDLGSPELLKMLVKDGYNTNVNLRDVADLTPLNYVCFTKRNSHRRRPEMAKFLISYGADVNINFSSGLTLLEYELNVTPEITDMLRYIVRSMLHPPRVEKLGKVVCLQYRPVPDGCASLRAYNKHIWYTDLVSKPRTLKHYCRFKIRKCLGPYNVKNIVKLPIPTALKSYLLLEIEE